MAAAGNGFAGGNTINIGRGIGKDSVGITAQLTFLHGGPVTVKTVS